MKPTIHSAHQSFVRTPFVKLFRQNFVPYGTYSMYVHNTVCSYTYVLVKVRRKVQYGK